MKLLHLLRSVSLPYARRHIGLTILTAAGVALGVAVFVAIQTASTSLKFALHDTLDRVAGKAQIQITSGEVGFPEEALDTVRAAAGVSAAAPVVEAIVRSEKASEGNIFVLGVDLTGDRRLRDYEFEGEDEGIDDPLVFLAQPDSICLSADFAARNHLAIDDQITFETALGPKAFTVRGLLAPKGFATAFGGNLAVMDIYAAEYVFNRGKRFDRIDVLLEPAVTIDAATRSLASSLGPGYSVDPPFRRGTQMESLLVAFSGAMDLSCWQALFIGTFLIFNVFAVAVARRRFEIGVLRSLGAGPRLIRATFLAEGLALGCAGSAAGITMGLVMARGATRFMSQLVQAAYGLSQVSAEVTWSAGPILTGAALGLGSSLLATWLPAGAAGRVDPVEALARGAALRFDPGRSRARGWAGLLTLIAAGLLRVRAGFTPGLPAALEAMGALGIAVILLAPLLTSWTSRLLRAPMSRLFGIEGRLAVDALLAAPRRTAATVAALLISVAFGISQAGYAASFSRSLTRWLDQSLNADFYVTGTERFISKAFQFPASYAEEIAKIPGVRHVERVRVVKQVYDGEQITVLALDAEKFLSRAKIWLADGDEARARRDFVAGLGVLVSDNFAARHHLHAGDAVALDTPSGRFDSPIAGVIVEYSSDRGSIYMDRAVYVAHFKDDRVDTFDVMLDPGADPTAMKTAILERFAGRGTRLFVFTGAEFRARIAAVCDQFFALTYVQFAIAFLVAVMGIVNALLISVAERRREIGILKAIGAVRGQVKRLFVLEAIAVAISGAGLGCLVGAYLTELTVHVLGTAISGWVFPFVYPTQAALASVPALIAVAIGAAWYPARLAVRTAAVEALAYE
ncbi:MAG: ABC transporter permease [Acidobacteria bacterium]|nr:ABC transporter permease [Acidobacteriota bacterium]